jgi:hypothetical protein
VRFLGEALDTAKRRRDSRLHCDILVQQLLIMQTAIPGDHAARLAHTKEILRVAEDTKSTYAILHCRRYRIALFLDSGAGAELDEEIELFAQESAAARCKQHYVAAFRAVRAIVSGRFEEATPWINEAEESIEPE